MSSVFFETENHGLDPWEGARPQNSLKLPVPGREE